MSEPSFITVDLDLAIIWNSPGSREGFDMSTRSSSVLAHFIEARPIASKMRRRDTAISSLFYDLPTPLRKCYMLEDKKTVATPCEVLVKYPRLFRIFAWLLLLRFLVLRIVAAINPAIALLIFIQSSLVHHGDKSPSRGESVVSRGLT